MSLELTGTIKKITEVQTFASGFQKREMVLLTEEQYPQPINIEFLQEKCDLLDTYKEGETITVNINIRGRLWESPQGEEKYFNSITGWRIEKKAGAAPTQNASSPPAAEKEKSFIESLDDDDDLEF